jgi:large subunit ribosomal protein L13
MSAKIAFIIQGKNSPHYKPNTILKNTDLCVIVNAKHTWLTGKKLEQKLYRHHTGFPGGLKEIKARHYLEKNPSEMLLRTIKGMTPKNKLRREYLKFVKIYDEGGHDLWKLGLPQFGKVKPIDYNEIFGLNDVLSGKAKILSSNIPENELPPEMKNLERANLEDQPKTVVNQRMKIKFDKYTKIWRYRQYRNIRNKSYRYI